MKSSTKVLNSLVAISALMIIATASVSAYEDGDHHRSRNHRGDMGIHSLIPQELRDQFKHDYQSLTSQQKLELRRERQTLRQENQAEMERLTGMTHDQIWQAKQNGQTIGEILQEKGVSPEQVEQFLTNRLISKVDQIVENHDLSQDQVNTLTTRIADFVSTIMDRWFDNK